MLKRTYEGQVCSVARALEVVGERWTLLVIREAMCGVTRFDDFLANLEVSRNVLSGRLRTLVANGLLDRVPYQDGPVRHEYHVTRKGRELATVLVALMDWGDRHCQGEHGPPRVAVHDACGGRVGSRLMCDECDREVGPCETSTRPPTVAEHVHRR